MNKQEKMISWILRLLGFLGMFAILAVIMPFGWMNSFQKNRFTPWSIGQK